jgi:hypothetical protein
MKHRRGRRSGESFGDFPANGAEGIAADAARGRTRADSQRRQGRGAHHQRLSRKQASDADQGRGHRRQHAQNLAAKLRQGGA